MHTILKFITLSVTREQGVFGWDAEFSFRKENGVMMP
jgi:hypothetical protein